MAIFKKLLSVMLITGIAFALIYWTFTSFDHRSPIFAFLINWLMMSWVAILGQSVTFPSFAPSYYAVKTFEQSGKFYERLGVQLFKKLVRRGPLAVFSPTLRFPKERTVPALRRLEEEMQKAETSHVLIFLCILLLAGYALGKGWLDTFFWLLLFNIFLNGYPVMLQRYNRLKIEEYINHEVGVMQPKEA